MHSRYSTVESKVPTGLSSIFSESSEARSDCGCHMWETIQTDWNQIEIPTGNLPCTISMLAEDWIVPASLDAKQE